MCFSCWQASKLVNIMIRNLLSAVSLFAIARADPFEALMESADGRVLQWFTAIDGFFEGSAQAEAEYDGNLKESSGVLVCKTKNGQSVGRYVIKQTFAYPQLKEQIQRERSKMCAKLAQVVREDTVEIAPVVASMQKISPVRKNLEGCIQSHFTQSVWYEVCANGLLKIYNNDKRSAAYTFQFASALPDEAIARVDAALSGSYEALTKTLQDMRNINEYPVGVLRAEGVCKGSQVTMGVSRYTGSSARLAEMDASFGCVIGGRSIFDFKQSFRALEDWQTKGTREATKAEVDLAKPAAQKRCDRVSYLVTNVQPLLLMAESGIDALPKA